MALDSQAKKSDMIKTKFSKPRCQRISQKEPVIKAKIGGKTIKVKPDNTMYSVVRHYGHYEPLK